MTNQQFQILLQHTGAYTVGAAADLLSVSPGEIRAWVRGRETVPALVAVRLDREFKAGFQRQN